MGGVKIGSGDLVFTRPDFLIQQQQNFSMESAGVKTNGTDLHLVVMAKGYDFRLKGMDILEDSYLKSANPGQ